ncbi:helix-turn-helix transcriptional regulator [Streptosporangium canum]|uniref:helix-turn-helix domain-containing protein n=1 Tax=Streptosporangium canum TaxID=324952 RepID=UPI0034385A05
MGTIEYSRLIRNAREAKGLTQQQVADAIGAKQTYVSDLERGQQNPDTEQLKSLYELFGVPVSGYFASGFGLDEVEWAIGQSDLSTTEQDVVLTVYGHLAKRNSLSNAGILRIGKEDPPKAQ